MVIEGQGQNKLGNHHGTGGQPWCLPELGKIAPEVGLEASEKEAGQGNISYWNKTKTEKEPQTLYFPWQASMCGASFSICSVPFPPQGSIETNKMFSSNISTFQLYLLHLQTWIFPNIFGVLTSFYLSQYIFLLEPCRSWLGDGYRKFHFGVLV